MRVIGLDIHRDFAEAAEIVDGMVRHLGRVDLVRDMYSPGSNRKPRRSLRMPGLACLGGQEQSTV